MSAVEPSEFMWRCDCGVPFVDFCDGCIVAFFDAVRANPCIELGYN